MVIRRRIWPRLHVVTCVHVNPYIRFRLGRWESVCEHYRSMPGQLAFDFYS